MKIIDLAFQGQHYTLGSDYQSKLEKSRTWQKALVVPGKLAATEVAELVDLNTMDLVVVLDEHQKAIGVVAPNTVARRAVKQLAIKPRSQDFADVVTEIAKKQRKDKAGFEWLNTMRPTLFWCDGGNHLTPKRPCPDHPT